MNLRPSENSIGHVSTRGQNPLNGWANSHQRPDRVFNLEEAKDGRADLKTGILTSGLVPKHLPEQIR